MNKERAPHSQIESDKEKTVRFLESFRNYLNNCIDDLPAERVKVGDPHYYQYKCITAWWQKIYNQIFLLEIAGLISDEIKKDIEDFKNLRTKIDWAKFRTREEIELANDFLRKMIAYLEKKLADSN